VRAVSDAVADAVALAAVAEGLATRAGPPAAARARLTTFLRKLLMAQLNATMRDFRQAVSHIGLNVGAVAGAGVPGHLHWHLVPRWPGDVNFMPSVAGVKVLPQSLDALWQQLRGAEPPRP
jgi:diadenosine tetraphosphate (Ap4A) HIT family hydrolase